MESVLPIEMIWENLTPLQKMEIYSLLKRENDSALSKLCCSKRSMQGFTDKNYKCIYSLIS